MSSAAEDFHVCGYESLFLDETADEGTSTHLHGKISPKMEIFKFLFLYVYTSDVFGASETSLPRI
jgi:hypothetical protein